MQALDLSPDEYRAFGEGVEALAHERGKNPGEFKAYQVRHMILYMSFASTGAHSTEAHVQ